VSARTAVPARLARNLAAAAEAERVARDKLRAQLAEAHRSYSLRALEEATGRSKSSIARLLNEAAQ
jgi:hypothetical protein